MFGLKPHVKSYPDRPCISLENQYRVHIGQSPGNAHSSLGAAEVQDSWDTIFAEALTLCVQRVEACSGVQRCGGFFNGVTLVNRLD